MLPWKLTVLPGVGLTSAPPGKLGWPVAEEVGPLLYGTGEAVCALLLTHSPLLHHWMGQGSRQGLTHQLLPLYNTNYIAKELTWNPLKNSRHLV